VLAGLVEEFLRVSLVLVEVAEAGFHGQGGSTMGGAQGGRGRRLRIVPRVGLGGFLPRRY
jgi:hypothetical protein